MKGAQQVVKIFAVVFAVFLVCGIGAALIGAGSLVGAVLGEFSGTESGAEWTEVAFPDVQEFDELIIEMKATNVRIEQGEEFQILMDEEVVEFRRDGGRIYLEEKDFGIFGSWRGSKSGFAEGDKGFEESVSRNWGGDGLCGGTFGG